MPYPIEHMEKALAREDSDHLQKWFRVEVTIPRRYTFGENGWSFAGILAGRDTHNVLVILTARLQAHSITTLEMVVRGR